MKSIALSFTALLMSLPLAGARAQCLALPAGCVAWWSGDGHSFDLVGANHGTNIGAVSYVPGQVGRAFAFATTNDWVNLPTNHAILSQTVGTVEFWAKILSLEDSTVRLFSVAQPGLPFPNANTWAVDYRGGGAVSGAIQVNLIAGGNIVMSAFTPAGTITDTNWHHVAVVADGVDPIQVFLDGSAQTLTGIFGSTADCFFGHATNASVMAMGAIVREAVYAEGVKQIDELCIYNRALSAGEIAGIYAAGSAGKCKPPVALPKGCVGWWSGDGHFFDLTARNHGTTTGGVAFVSAEVGRAFNFDGVTGFLEVADNADLRLTNTLTIEFWAKRQRVGIDLVLEKGGDWNTAVGGEANYGVGLHTINNRMFYFNFRGGWRGTTGVQDFEWHHYAVVATNGQTQPAFYIDGAAKNVEYSGGAPTISLFPSSKPLHIGAQIFSTWNYHGNNLLDELSIYNRALSSEEIASIHATSSAGKRKPPFPAPAGLISWWPAETNARDVIGTNHGTAQGMVTYDYGKVGQAFDFNGANTWLVMPPVFTNAAVFSFEGWMKVRRFTNPYYTPILCQPCESQSPDCIPGEYWFFAGNETSYGSFRFTAVWQDATQADVHSVIPFGVGTWEHVAVTYDGEKAKVYWNGQLHIQENYAGKIMGNASPFWVGRAFVPHSNGIHENAYLDGLIDELSVYSRALTSEEVAAIHAAGSAGKSPPLRILGPVWSNGNLVFTFATVTNQSYTVQFTDDLTTTNWLFYTDMTGTGGNMGFATRPTDSRQRFFRVRQP